MTTPAEAVTAARDYFIRLDLDRGQFRDWVGGEIFGGPNGNGQYPLTDFTDNTQFIKCPARIIADVGGGGGGLLPNYTWIAYADSGDGQTNFATVTPGDRSFIGIAANRADPIESILPEDYTWSRYRGLAGNNGVNGLDGSDGIGTPGADGITLYTWIAYASSADGTVDFTTGAGGTRTYIGLANNRASPTEGIDPAAYSWSLIRGSDGLDGSDGLPGSPGSDGTSTFTWIAYANSADGAADFTIGSPGARTHLGIAPNKSSSVESTTSSDYTWSLIKGTDGIAGSPGADGVTLYTWIAYATNATGTAGFTSGANTGQTYIGIANNKTTAVEGADPTLYTWSLIKGSDGTDGVPGTPGADGAPTYTWFAYADSSNGVTNFTTGVPGTRLYLGIAPNRSTETEGTDPSAYNWSLIKGSDGTDGVPGTPGADGNPGANGAPGADGISLIASPASAVFSANSTGVLDALQLPLIVNFAALLANVNVSAAAVWGNPLLTDCAVTNLGGGNYQIDSVSADSGNFVINVTASGRAATQKFTFAKARAGAAAQSAPLVVNGTPNPNLNIYPGNAISISINRSYRPNINGSSGQTARLYYRNITDAGAWTQAGTDIVGSTASRTEPSPGEIEITSGSCSGVRSVPAPTSVKQYEFRADVAVSGVAQTTTFSQAKVEVS